MDMKETAETIEQTLVASHLNDIRLLAQEGSADRRGRIYSVLTRLAKQHYLIGTGPYTAGIYRLSMDETMIGRMASPLEESSGVVIDISVNDWITLTPREVSRVHAKIVRKGSEHRLADMRSRLGTYLNGRLIERPAEDGEELTEENSRRLKHGDVVSLGPSHVNTFVFVQITGEEAREE